MTTVETNEEAKKNHYRFSFLYTEVAKGTVASTKNIEEIRNEMHEQFKVLPDMRDITLEAITEDEYNEINGKKPDETLN